MPSFFLNERPLVYLFLRWVSLCTGGRIPNHLPSAEMTGQSHYWFCGPFPL